MKYEFNKEKHRHFLDGKQLTGCTTVLGIVAKPALISWSANMTAEFLRDKLDGIKNLDQMKWELLLDEARKQHTKRKEKAGDWGIQVHFEIENYIQNEIDKKGNEVYPENIKNFVEWEKQNKVKFLATEKNIYSEKMFVGGIVDIVCEIDGKRWIGDIKTSGSGIYPENFWQCACYDLLLEEMGEPKAEGYIILNLKENGEFIEKRSISNEENKEAFLSCLKIYRIQEKIKNQVI